MMAEDRYDRGRTTGLLVGRRSPVEHRRPRGGRDDMPGFRRALAALGGVHPRARLAERSAAYLRGELPAEDYVVLARYVPRDDSDEEVSMVVVGPHGVLVVEPRDDEGDLVCYQDHWYRRTPLGDSHALHDSPSNRARWNAARVKSDLASGGFIYTAVEGVVVLTRGRPDDVRSSCVPVCVGLDELVGQLMLHEPSAGATAEHTRALVEALAKPIRLMA